MSSRPSGPPRRGTLHHLELWCPDLAASEERWDWLLRAIGLVPRDRWPHGRSWAAPDGSYVVLESGPDVTPGTTHERRRPGLNHVAFHAGTRAEVDAVVARAPQHGWSLLFADRHPYAGGPGHYAAYLEDVAGFEVELVAHDPV